MNSVDTAQKNEQVESSKRLEAYLYTQRIEQPFPPSRRETRPYHVATTTTTNNLTVLKQISFKIRCRLAPGLSSRPINRILRSPSTV